MQQGFPLWKAGAPGGGQRVRRGMPLVFCLCLCGDVRVLNIIIIVQRRSRGKESDEACLLDATCT